MIKHRTRTHPRTHRRYEQRRQELQVRLTAQRILTAHLKPEAAALFWVDIDLNLTDAYLHQLDLTACHVQRAQFKGATFTAYAGFRGATFAKHALFDRATFVGRAVFDGATFAGRASFSGATFAERAAFKGTTFAGAVMSSCEQVSPRGRQVEGTNDRRCSGGSV